VPDTWIYVQERDVKVGRLQIFNNWSPYMVADYKGSMFVGMEYFCNEGDSLWNMEDSAFRSLAVDELVKIGVVERDDVLDTTCARIRKAYPAYFGTYNDFPVVRDWLDAISNLWCIGRNGQHRYNNMDHSMLTAMEAVRCIGSGITSKEDVWNVNTEKEYHETKNN
jgi:protoporphyrinogen oxidase